MAGENSYTVCFEAVPKQQLRTDFILLVSDVFPRYRDEDIEGDFCIQEVMFELVADIF